MKKTLRKLATLAALLASAGSQAALVNAPVAANAYISFGGLDWAWAYPLPASNGLDLSFQSQFGWRLPTLAELAAAPLAAWKQVEQHRFQLVQQSRAYFILVVARQDDQQQVGGHCQVLTRHSPA